MGELGALFNPGMRHEIEERQSKAMRREEEGSARKGDLRIDLDSGVAVIPVAGPSPTSDDSDPTVDGDRLHGQPGPAGDGRAARTPAKPAATAPAKPAATPAKPAGAPARSARKSDPQPAAKTRSAETDGEATRHTIRGKRAASRA